MLQNASVSVYTVSELIRENQWGGGELPEKENYPSTHTPALKIDILFVPVN